MNTLELAEWLNNIFYVQVFHSVSNVLMSCYYQFTRYFTLYSDFALHSSCLWFLKHHVLDSLCMFISALNRTKSFSGNTFEVGDNFCASFGVVRLRKFFCNWMSFCFLASFDLYDSIKPRMWNCGNTHTCMQFEIFLFLPTFFLSNFLPFSHLMWAQLYIIHG